MNEKEIVKVEASISTDLVLPKKNVASIIKSFTIKGLFGDRDVKIPFNTNVKILIGENGLGKTTVLNILYFLLTNKYYKLKGFDFKELILQFHTGESVNIKKENLLHDDENEPISVPSRALEAISRNLSSKDINFYSNLFETDAPRRYIIEMFSLHAKNDIRSKYPSSWIYNGLKIICGYGVNNEIIKKSREIINNHIGDYEILYFPTFRRIEEDLISLGFNENTLNIKQGDTVLIQFGMKDVKEKLEQTKIEINGLSSKGLAQISSEILSQLIKGIPNINEFDIENIRAKDIEIILARVGKAIPEEDKSKILEILSDKKLSSADDKYLLYFLQKLIQIYEQQKNIDNSIDNFVSVCNKYLNMSNKSLFYEASEVEFYLITNARGNKVLLNDLLDKLSSGEKQILSLFSRIYLDNDKDFIVLFDEPELSLSIFWQTLLLPDIINSTRCKFLLSVTHSPFIFENELTDNAIGLNQYIKYSKK